MNSVDDVCDSFLVVWDCNSYTILSYLFRMVELLALMIAAQKDDETSMQMLLQADADTTLRDKVS